LNKPDGDVRLRRNSASSHFRRADGLQAVRRQGIAQALAVIHGTRCSWHAVLVEVSTLLVMSAQGASRRSR
jgi:hypothetical protein